MDEEIRLTFQPDIRLKESILKTIFTPANSKTGKPLGATTAQLFTQSCRVVISRRSCSPLRAFIRYFSRFFFANNICKTPADGRPGVFYFVVLLSGLPCMLLSNGACSVKLCLPVADVYSIGRTVGDISNFCKRFEAVVRGVAKIVSTGLWSQCTATGPP